MSVIAVGTAPLGSTPSRRRFLFVDPGRWTVAVVGSLLAALALFPLYANDSPWVGVGVALMALLTWHSLVVGRRLPWIPGLALATAALQWIIAPWITYHVGAYFATFDMLVPQEEYFGYAVPAFAMLTAGMLWLLRRPGRTPPPPLQGLREPSKRFRATCDGMVVIGALTQLVVAPMLGGGSLAFLGVLVANLAFVGALALLLARAPGWPLRVAAVLTVQALVSAANGMFHDLVLWSAYFFLTLISVYRLRLRTIVIVGSAAMAAIMVLNVVKQEYRRMLQTTDAGLFGRAAILGSTMAESATDPTVAYEGSGFKANVTRLNQGWIIARVLYWVPQREPFAGGETITASIRATLLPRFLDPDKLEVGGHTYFERFTGMTLRGTSMDLSAAGEMYANFGYWGGLFGVFVFGALIGGVYRVFLRLGRRSPLWWAWAPYVLLYSTKAENGIAEVTNHLAKSGIVMIAVISLVPAWVMLRKPLTQGVARALRLRRAPNTGHGSLRVRPGP